MNRLLEMGKRFLHKYKNFPVVILIVVNLIIISFTLTDYGESWDENHQYTHYADHALKAYGTWFREGRSEGLIESSGVAKDLHGPAYVMTVEFLTRLISRINPGWFKTDIRHFLHFLTFQLGLFSFYAICRRWLDSLPSLGATLLFITQPVIWGHGIINPKDMPFTALFLLSIALGLHMYDYIFPAVWDRTSSSWSMLDHQTKRMIGVIVAIWAVSIFMLFAGTKTVFDISVSVINHAYSNPNDIISVIISQYAKNFGMVPVDIYTQKLFIIFLRLRGIYAIGSTVFIISMISRKFRPGLLLLGAPVLFAGFALGFVTSMRIAGPLAGLLVVIYILGHEGRKAFIPISIYGFISIISMYITWPYLWGDPTGRLFDSLQVMSAFPWNQQVLFNGAKYTADTLPKTYLAVLFGIQLTEPVWILFLAGATVAVTRFIKTRRYGWLLFLLLGWFILPMITFSIGGFSFYDNFRQVLFILPPVFLMAGVAFSKIKRPTWQIAVITLAILPGIVDGIHLHPYEYIYYNRFIGGVNGAQRRFELDYWATSYREAAEYVNSIAAPNSYVWVEGPAHIFNSFARDDLKVLDAFDSELIMDQEYYFVALSRYNLDLLLAPDTKLIYTVSRDGAPLTVIKKK